MEKLFLVLVFLTITTAVFAADMTVDSSGNVGVGTTMPGAKLDVYTTTGDAIVGESAAGYAGYFEGNTRVTGDLTVDGTLTAPGIGDITGVTAGTGLRGGGTSGDVTLDADTAYLQRRVSSSCPDGSSIRVINSDGTVSCETDDDSGGDISSVNAGTGLTVTSL